MIVATVLIMSNILGQDQKFEVSGSRIQVYVFSKELNLAATAAFVFILQGYYLRPTVVTDVSDSSRLMTEEIFGPIVCIVPFQTEEEVMIFLKMKPTCLCLDPLFDLH